MRSNIEVRNLSQLMESSYNEMEKFIGFMQSIRGPQNDFSGKYSVKKHILNQLFDEKCWSNIATKDGHRIYEHRLTHIHLGYQAHNGELLPAKGALNIMEQLQNHVNIFFKNYIGCSPRNRPGTRLHLEDRIDFNARAQFVLQQKEKGIDLNQLPWSISDLDGVV